MYCYLHVPFCRSRCIYCDFYVVLEKYGGQAAYVDALCREIEARCEGLNDNQRASSLQSLYVGGGTPSLLHAQDYERIIEVLTRYLLSSSSTELTLEANPGEHGMIDPPKAYRQAGFNRVSVGVQSFVDTELKQLSRIHTAEEAQAFIRHLQRAGFDNLSIDLMYALPGQTLASWRRTLEVAVSLNVQHISMYGLKVEDNTPLERLVTMGASTYQVPGDELNVAMYFEALDFLKHYGYQRYEFSNLARPGFESRHNRNYWQNGEYLAFGASAHGYLNDTRYENVRDLQGYLDNPLSATTTPCPPQERLENAIIFGLRQAEGIDVAAIEREFDIDFRNRYKHVLQRFEGESVHFDGARLVLDERAIPLSNAILAEFLN